MKRLRRVGGAVVVAGIVVGIIVVLSGNTPKTAKPTTTGSTGTTATTTSTTLASSTANAIAPVCPPATAAGAPKRETAFKAAPPMCVKAGQIYEATVTTDAGTFVMKMPVSASPLAVNNFVFLARYHFYDGVTFHRVIPGFVVQGGDPTGSGSGGPGYSFTGNTPPASCQKKSDCYPLGSVAMANSGKPSSNGSQFFVVVGPSGEQLAPNYTLFGQVISGMSAVNKIAAGGSVAGTPSIRYNIVKVTIAQVAK